MEYCSICYEAEGCNCPERVKALEAFFEKTGNILDCSGGIPIFATGDERYRMLWNAICEAREIVHAVPKVDI